MVEISTLMAIYKEPLDIIKLSIESTIRSLDRFSYEFIIVIDNPNVEDEINNYLEKINNNKNIIIIRNMINSGLAQSLNKGLESATGKYIMRMDADDICLPERAKLQFEYLETHKDVDLVGGAMVKIDIDGKSKGISLPPAKAFNSLERDNPIFCRTICFHPTWLIRASILRKFKYRDLKTSQDLELLFRLLSNGRRISNLSKPLVKYRISNSSLSVASGWRQVITRLALNRLYSRNDTPSTEEVSRYIHTLSQSKFRKSFEIFHETYTNSLLERNFFKLGLCLTLSPYHIYKFYLLLKSKYAYQ